MKQLRLGNKNISWSVGILIPVLLLLAIFYNLIFTVPETKIGVMSTHNNATFFNPGLHWKQPLAKLQYFSLNQRLEIVSGIPVTVRSLPSSYIFNVLWQVGNPKLFWQQTENNPDKLEALFKNALNTSVNASAAGDSTSSLAAELTMELKQNQALQDHGIEVQQVLLTEQTLSQSALQVIYQEMQELANKIAESIVINGAKQADRVRSEGDEALIRIEGQAASAAATSIGAGQAQAIAINAPLYHQNPEFFKLLVNTKTLLLQKQGN